MRLGPHKLSAHVLSQLMVCSLPPTPRTTIRESGDLWVVKKPHYGGRNSNERRHWRRTLRTVVAVAHDALESGRRTDAIRILCSLIHVDNAIRLVDDGDHRRWFVYEIGPPIAFWNEWVLACPSI